LKLVTRQILRQIWVPAIAASAVISFVLIAGAIQTEIRDLLKDVPIAQFTIVDISWISFYSLPTLVGYLFPVTFLMAIMLTFGRMSQQNEITALKAAGIPLKRLIAPVLVLGALLSGVCYYVQDQAQPWAYKHLSKLLRSDLPLRVTLDMLPAGIMHEYADWRVYIGHKDPDGTLRDIAVLQPTVDGHANAFYADSARLVKENGVSTLEMRKGHYILADKGDMIPRTTFEVGRRTVPQLKPRETEKERKAMSMAELFDMDHELQAKFDDTRALPVERDLRATRIEFGHRVAFPLMCLAVSFLAAPIGARIKRAGRSSSFASGLFILCIYFVMSRALDPRGLLPLTEVILIMQVPNIVMLLAGTALIWRVDRV
jgi:lipopolysaccharide export system permease protein